MRQVFFGNSVQSVQNRLFVANERLTLNMTKGALMLFAGILLSSCSVGPDFLRPDAPDVSSYTEETLPDKTASSDKDKGVSQTFVHDKDVLTDWWKVFGSEPLNRLVDQALKANPDLQAAEAGLRKTQENLSAQKASFFPAVDITAGDTRQKFAGASVGQANRPSSIFTLYNASVNVSYGFDIFGKLRRAVESLEAQAEADRFRYEAAYVTLTANIVTAAVREASLREQIKETEHIAGIEREQLKVLQIQLDLGSVAKSAVLVQEANLAQTVATLPPLQKQLAQTRSQLAVLIGQTPAETLDARFALASLTLPEELPVTLPSKLVEQRPDIKASESLLHAASANIGVAAANMLPDIDITGSYGSITPSFTDMFSSGAIVWNIGAGLTQPLFHGGRLLHQKRASEAAYDQAVAQYKGVVLQAFQNVSDSLTAIRYDAETLNAQATAADAASKSLELATSQYKLGGISHLVLLDAERTYRQARIALIQAQAARVADSAALFQSLGGGWWNRPKETGDTPPATTDDEIKPMDDPETKPTSGEAL